MRKGGKMKGFAKMVMSIRPAVFILLIIMFFLPFAEIKCDSTVITEIKGIEFVTGKEIKSPSEKKVETEKKMDPDIYAIIAFAAAVIGLLLSFISNKFVNILNGLISFTGMVMLLLMKNNLDTQVINSEESFGLITISYKFGFWIAFALFLGYGLVTLSVELTKGKR